MSNDLRKRLEDSALGKNEDESKARVAPTDEETSMFLSFLRSIGFEVGTNKIQERKINQQILTGEEAGASTRRLFANKDSKAN